MHRLRILEKNAPASRGRGMVETGAQTNSKETAFQLEIEGGSHVPNPNVIFQESCPHTRRICIRSPTWRIEDRSVSVPGGLHGLDLLSMATSFHFVEHTHTRPL